jgi:peptidoglycan-N-acetylglucosamine deacetylase
MKLLLYSLIFLVPMTACQTQSQTWPANKEAAISLSFDDARESQVLIGTRLLDSFGVKATFYVIPSGVQKQIEGWKKAVARGHEIGNHTVTHPCSGNFNWSRNNALENYTLEKIRYELTECNRQIKALLNVDAKTFAYPCGQKYVGSGTGTLSYVPMVAELFRTGRGYKEDNVNDPQFCNLSQLSSFEIDGKSFEEILPVIEEARKNKTWIIFGGHEINKDGFQTTKLETLTKLLAYAKDPANKIWIETVSNVEKYISSKK